jgi:hypothetical protein
MMVIVLLDTHQDAITHKSPNTTLMSVIRGTTVRKGTFVLILVAVNFFPTTIGVRIQRIAYLNYGL